jgi:hypothetical protein
MALRAFPLCIACVASGALSCGSSSSGLDVASLVGVYSATYSGTYNVQMPAVAMGMNTSTATITVSDLSNGQIGLTFQVPPNPQSGVIRFALTGLTGELLSPATGGECFKGQVSTNTQSNCCTACSIMFTGNNMFTQPNAGTFTGTTSAGQAYSGTYSGTWTGTKK